MLAVVILAAGESRRMGRPKALLPFPDSSGSQEAKEKKIAGLKPAATKSETFLKRVPPVGSSATNPQERSAPKTFLEHLIEVTRHPHADILRVVVGAHESQIHARVQLPADAIVVNREWEKGQLSSLQTAIRSLAAGETEGMLVCLVDHPLISAQLVSLLVETFERDKNKIVMPTYHGKRGHPVIFPSALYAELLAAPENIGARVVVRAHAADVIEVPVEEEGVVINLNDPAALNHVRKHN